MKKSFCTVMLATIAMVAGTVLADTNYQYDNWFKGIGDSPTSLSALGESGGSWTGLDGTGVSFANSKIVLDDVETAINFTISATEPDTEVMDRVQITMSGLAGSLSSLPSGSDLTDANAQLSVSIANDNNELGYYAWVGGDSWQKLNGADPTEDSDFVLTVDIDYSVANAPKVRFSVGNTVLTLDGNEWTAITAAAAQSVRKISGVKFGGNGKLAKVDGTVRLGVAVAGGVKYPTIQAAVDAAAASSGSDKTVSVYRKTTEDVNLSGKADVVLNDNGNNSGTVTVPADQPIKIAPVQGEFIGSGETGDGGASGTYTLKTKFSGGTLTTSSVILPSTMTPYKEVSAVEKNSDGQAVVTIRTKDSNVAAVSVGGRTLLVTEGLRAFLDDHVPAYAAKDSSTDNLQSGLMVTGENALPKWQSYVLGLDPSDSTSVPKFQPVGADDSSTSSLLVKVPAVNPPNDSGYTVKFRLSDNGTKVADYDNPQSIPLPLDGAAHAYTIKPVIISQ